MSPRTVSTFHSCAGLNAIPYSSTHGRKGLTKFIPRDSFNSSLYILFSMLVDNLVENLVDKLVDNLVNNLVGSLVDNLVELRG